MNRLLILDGNALLHRAFHALPPLTSPTGEPTGAVYGFVSMLLRLKTDLTPTHYAVCFDRPKPTFRNELFKEYQAQRPAMDEALVKQITTIHQVMEAFGVPMFECDGFEADDVIATIVKEIKRLRDKETKKKSLSLSVSESPSLPDQIIIVTGDRDILQLVEDENVLVYMPVKGLSEAKLYGEKEVIERIGVKPKDIPDWKALSGDSSDNYPGVAGIGPKTAANLVNTYHTIEALYEAIEQKQADVSATVVGKLEAGKKSAILSKKLAVIRDDAPVEIDVHSLYKETFDSEGARHALGGLGFHSLQKRLAGTQTPVESKEKKKPEKKKNDTSTEQLPLV